MESSKKAIGFPSPAVLISVLIGATLLVAVGVTLTKDNDTGTAGTQSTITEYGGFVSDVANQTIGEESESNLLPSSVIPLIVLGAVLAFAAAIVGFRLF